jgi:hypothetical protein
MESGNYSEAIYPVGDAAMRLIRLSLILVAVALLAAPALAQTPGEKPLSLKKDGAAEAKPLFSVQPDSVPPKRAAKRAAAIELKPAEGVAWDVAWNDYFAANVEPPAKVRETCRVLLEGRDFKQLIAMLQGALRNGQPAPWMYEAMGLAMQLDEQPLEDIERTLMSAADFATTPDELLNLAVYMEHVGLDARALEIYRQVAELQPLRPDPYAYGLAVAKRTDNTDGLRWAVAGILRQAWPSDQRNVWDDAFRVAQAHLKSLQESGQKKEAAEFQAELDKALVRDCIVKVSWTGDADIDVMVEEPSGTVCSLRNPRSVGGGVMMDDAFARFGHKQKGVSEEIYACPQGFSGDYKVLIRRVWGKVTAGKVTVDLYTNYRTKDEQHQSMTIPLGEKDAEVKFSLADGRRTEPLREQQLAKASQEQMEVGRAILAQQLSSAIDPRVAAELARRNIVGPQQPLNGNNVGFQPVIITLPAGTNMAVFGVISADRRYVRITALPVFSSIGDVTTFTFAGGSQLVPDSTADADAVAN